MTPTSTAALLIALLTGQSGGPSTASPSSSVTVIAPPTARPSPAQGEKGEGTPSPPDVAMTPSAMRALQARTEAALARAQALEQQLTQLQQARQADQQRIAVLERQVAEERARRQEAEQSPGQRQEALGTAVGNLDGAVNGLAVGSDDVGASLAQAQALAAEASRNAAQHGSPDEALQADEAQRLLSVSQEALSRGDLFQARQAAAAASRAAQRAGRLAGTPPPASTGSGGSSY